VNRRNGLIVREKQSRAVSARDLTGAARLGSVSFSSSELLATRGDAGLTVEHRYYLDPRRGYALLASQTTMLSTEHAILRRVTRIVDQLSEAAPGAWYPAHAKMYWEEQATSFEWSEFTVTKATANVPMTENVFKLTFPAKVNVTISRTAVWGRSGRDREANRGCAARSPGLPL